MKKLCLVAVLLIALVLTGCSDLGEAAFNMMQENKSSSLTTMTIEGYGIEMDYPDNWNDITEGTQFDLYCSDGSAFNGIFVYYDIDLAKGVTPRELLDDQTGDMLALRENPEFLDEKTVLINDKSVTTVRYFAEKESRKYHYYFAYVEFDETTEKFAWILFTGVPSEAEKDILEWDMIVQSMRLVEE